MLVANSLQSEIFRSIIYTCPVDHAGTSLFVKGWIDESAQKRPMLIVHDLGETAEAMAQTATAINQTGRNVYCFDMRGHGQSGRNLGHIASFNQLSLDLLQIAAWVRYKEEGRKPILLAQGMGSLVALFFAKNFHDISAGLVLLSPLMVDSQSVNRYHRFFIKTLADMMPNVLLPSFLCPKVINQRVRQAKSSVKISALLANELLLAILQAKRLLQRLRQPTLIVSPQNSSVCPPKLIQGLMAKNHQHISLQTLEISDAPHALMAMQSEKLIDLLSLIEEWLETI